MQEKKKDKAAIIIFLFFKTLATIVVVIFSIYGFSGCSVAEMGNLKDFTKSYCGTYECTKAVLGEVNLLDGFEYIRLELKTDGTAVFYFKPVGGKKAEREGQYVKTEKEGEIILSSREFSKTYSVKLKISNGEIDIVENYGNRQMYVKFEMT